MGSIADPVIVPDMFIDLADREVRPMTPVRRTWRLKPTPSRHHPMAFINYITQIQIEFGAVQLLRQECERTGMRKPLIVSDAGVRAAGVLDKAIKALGDLSHAVFDQTPSNPTETAVRAAAKIFQAEGCDGLIAVGGGSSMDLAKGVAIAVTHEGPLKTYATIEGGSTKIRDRVVPLIAVPTTAGTGSEATRFTVITDTERGEKMLIAGMGALPLAAVVDYELTFTVPRRITADTGVDSLTHALEAYVSRRANPYSDAQALAAMALIGANLRTAYAEPHNAPAREAMMLGAMQAGIAFTNSSVALVHGMSRPIGAHFHVPHGLSNAMLLPAITRFGLEAAEARYATAARTTGFADGADRDAMAAGKLADGLAQLNRDLDVPTPGAFGITKAAWDARLAAQVDDPYAPLSPRVALWSGLAGLVMLTVFLTTIGLPLGVVLAFWAVYFLFLIVLTRIFAEAGAGWAWGPMVNVSKLFFKKMN